jgi:type II secretory pathway pseudopilin PulG
MEKTDSQISSTPPTEHRSQRGFTLVELLIGATLSGFTLAGVLSTFLLMGRTGANIRNYSEIEAKARASLEQFSREARLAYDVTAYSANSVTLSIPDTTSTRNGTGTGAYSVTYAFDTTNQLLTRTGPPINTPTGTVATTTLITGVQQLPGTTSFLSYYRYVKPTTYTNVGEGYFTGFGTNTATSAREIKQVEVSFLLQRKEITVATATNKVLSARFILRNK